MLRPLLLLLFLFLKYYAHSQVLTVVDSASSAPLEFVSIISKTTHHLATTNSKGQVDLSTFPKGEQIEIRMLGYESVSTSFQKLAERNYKLKLKFGVLNMDEVVISDSRWKESSGKVPARITTISPRQVALQNPQTAADLLGISGQVFIQKSQQGGGSPMIRGFATNRLLYTVDGIRMNTAIFRGGNIQNVINLDPFVMENTEVFFGPASVMYGSDAIGGVMSFQTLSPNFSLQEKPLVSGKAVARLASANRERTGHVDVNVGWKKFALISSISYWDYWHLRQGSHGPEEYVKPFFVERKEGEDRLYTQKDELLQVPSAYEQLNLMQKFRYQPVKHWDLQYGFHYSETSPYGRYDRHNRMRNGLPRYAEWDYGPQQWMMNALTLAYSKPHSWFDRLNFRLARQDFSESRISRDLLSTERSLQEETVAAYSANLDFDKKLGSRNRLFYGLEFVQNEVDSEGELEHISTGITSIGPSRYPQARWSAAGIYLNNEYELTEELNMQSGIRYSRYALQADFDPDFYALPFQEAEMENDALTTSLGMVWRPDEELVVKSSVGTAYRAPNVDDMGKVFDSEPGAVTVPNPDLQAEYATNLEAGVAKIRRCAGAA